MPLAALGGLAVRPPNFGSTAFETSVYYATHMSVETLGIEVRRLLAADPGPSGRDRVRRLLQEALADRELWASHLGDEQPQRRVLYHDAELGFSILGHVYHEARRAKPHDHAATWAIYAQFEGTTSMDEWEVIEAATADGPGKVRKTRTYELTPGDAHTYNEGVVHSPSREGPAKLVRIEGGPIDPDVRREYEIA